MQYAAFVIALGIVVLFGVWSGRRQRRLSKKLYKKKGENVYPLRKSKRAKYLRRVK